MYHDDGSLNYGPAMFVISYIVIVVWVLLQAGPHMPCLHCNVFPFSYGFLGTQACRHSHPLEPFPAYSVGFPLSLF